MLVAVITLWELPCRPQPRKSHPWPFHFPSKLSRSLVKLSNKSRWIKDLLRNYQGSGCFQVWAHLRIFSVCFILYYLCVFSGVVQILPSFSNPRGFFPSWQDIKGDQHTSPFLNSNYRSQSLNCVYSVFIFPKFAFFVNVKYAYIIIPIL